MRATVFASSLAATLEMVREGQIEIHQDTAFAPIYLRKRADAPGNAAASAEPARPKQRLRTTGKCQEGDVELGRATHDHHRRRQEPDADARPEELRLLEALLFAAGEPLDEKTLAARLPPGPTCARCCAGCRPSTRRAASISCASATNGRSAPPTILAWLLTHEAIEPKKLSRAAMETLAIVAYHQPVTRAEIEEIRGVTAAKGTIDVLLEIGWIRPRGRRKAPGRPMTYGTNEAFLSHFGLETLSDLPGLDELKGSGLFDASLPAGFAVPMPSDDPALREDEEPLEEGDLDLALAPAACLSATNKRYRASLPAWSLFLPLAAPRFSGETETSAPRIASDGGLSQWVA